MTQRHMDEMAVHGLRPTRSASVLMLTGTSTQARLLIQSISSRPIFLPYSYFSHGFLRHIPFAVLHSPDCVYCAGFAFFSLSILGGYLLQCPHLRLVWLLEAWRSMSIALSINGEWNSHLQSGSFVTMDEKSIWNLDVNISKVVR